jgi:hypothetical protein
MICRNCLREMRDRLLIGFMWVGVSWEEYACFACSTRDREERTGEMILQEADGKDSVSTRGQEGTCFQRQRF